MTRDEALQWCVKHVEEWPEGYTPQFAPKGWSWFKGVTTNTPFLINKGRFIINRNDWMKATRRVEVSVKVNLNDAKFLRALMYGPKPDTTPCGQSFNELMSNLNS